MKHNHHSRSAERTAGLRALHTLCESQLVFSDPYAAMLTNPMWRLLLRWRGMARILASSQAHLLTANRGQVIARSRYAEDGLVEAIASGVRQYVIVGAGMDSFALRHTTGPEDLVVYEVDHPASQSHKARFTSRHNSALLPGGPGARRPI
jgi:methyltransferase (TIGR00027 family)